MVNTNVEKVQAGDLRIWWIPQVPGKPFIVPVKDFEQAVFINNTLSLYDLFQFENHIKPDYANAGGLEVFEEGEWQTWYNEAGEDFDYVLNNEKEERLEKDIGEDPGHMNKLH